MRRVIIYSGLLVAGMALSQFASVQAFSAMISTLTMIFLAYRSDSHDVQDSMRQIHPLYGVDNRSLPCRYSGKAETKPKNSLALAFS